MRFWNRSKNVDLERRLRNERPQAREDFVRMLSRKLPVPLKRAGRSASPRIALVAAVTVALAASLGAAGALGNARGSLTTFGRSIEHVVQSPSHHNDDGTTTTTTTTSGPTTTSSFTGTDTGGNNVQPDNFRRGDDDDDNDDPFHHQYGIKVPICHDGQIILVPIQEYFYDLRHGDHRWQYCIFHRHHHDD